MLQSNSRSIAIKTIVLIAVCTIGFSFSGKPGGHLGIGIDTRYNLGLNNINNASDYNTNKVYNRVFQLGLFYQFGH